MNTHYCVSVLAFYNPHLLFVVEAAHAEHKQQWSISSMLNAQILRTKAFFTSYVLALNELLYKKHARKTLMKFKPGSL